MNKANIAVLHSGDLAYQRRQLEKTWSGFLHNPQESFSMRSVVLDSWSRCIKSGVDPASKNTAVPLHDSKMEIYDLCLPTLNELAIQTDKTGFVVALCDTMGRIVFLSGDRDIQHKAEKKINFALGTEWQEGTIGTNAIGTCLATGQAVQVFAAEHFCEVLHDWVCSSSPIRDPVTNEILGVIDITGQWKNAQPHTLGMTTIASKLIQHSLLEQAQFSRHLVLKRYFSVDLRYPRNGVVALDAGFHLVEMNYRASKFFTEEQGRSLERLLNNKELSTSLKAHHNELCQDNTYELFITEFGLRIVVEEIYRNKKRIGFVLTFDLPNFSSVRTNSWTDIIGTTKEIRSVISKCDTVAQANVPVVLFGESGTGKEIFARAIHEKGSRCDRPFVAVNCGAIPKELLASELFGYEPGSFTGANKAGKKGKFEEADGGTLFLDEVGDMPLDFQVHLLRVIQEQEVVRLGSVKPKSIDVRIIAATHRNLEQLVQEGLFRADLYYRLNVVSICVPPLRERREDIPLLISDLLNQMAAKHEKPPIQIDERVNEYLVNEYPWPGNVRELQNVIEHAFLFCPGSAITFEDLPQYIQKRANCSGRSDNTRDIGEQTKPLVGRFHHERQVLLSLITESNGNLSDVARRLGIARTTLYRRMKNLQIEKVKNDWNPLVQIQSIQ